MIRRPVLVRRVSAAGVWLVWGAPGRDGFPELEAKLGRWGAVPNQPGYRNAGMTACDVLRNSAYYLPAFL